VYLFSHVPCDADIEVEIYEVWPCLRAYDAGQHLQVSGYPRPSLHAALRNAGFVGNHGRVGGMDGSLSFFTCQKQVKLARVIGIVRLFLSVLAEIQPLYPGAGPVSFLVYRLRTNVIGLRDRGSESGVWR
jgi:hypothetical protein